LVALAFVSASAARACDTAALATRESTCVVQDRLGVPGVWFVLATAEELRASHQLVPELRLQLEKYNEIDLQRTAEAIDLRNAIASQRDAVAKLKAETVASDKAMRAAQDDATAARTDLDRWWRSPFLWFAVGALAGALAGVAIASH
jgi:hypothetical protein